MTLANEALPELRVRALLVAKPMSAASRRKLEIQKFVTIGYGDRAGYQRPPKDVREAAPTHDGEIKKRGALIGVAARRCKCAIHWRLESRRRTPPSCRPPCRSPASR